VTSRPRNHVIQSPLGSRPLRQRPPCHAHIRVRVSCHVTSRPRPTLATPTAQATPTALIMADSARSVRCQQKFDESATNELIQQNTRHTLTRRRLHVDFDRHLAFIGSGNGEHFDCCAYIIDLTQYWFIEYIFSRRSSNSC